MGLRYTLIYVLRFKYEHRFASTTANIESKIDDFLKGKKATVGGCNDRPNKSAAQQQDELSVAKRIQIPRSTGCIDKRTSRELHCDHIVHVKASQLRSQILTTVTAKYPNQDLTSH